jgi:hypothetical protein
MALSVCCLTSNPARAAAVLSGVRGVADEIVVAVDVSAGEQDLAPLERVADGLFRIELEGFPEQAVGWLREQCSADWLLRLDDDEVVSAGLLEQLPELMAAGDVVQYWLARRWLYGDPGRWLEEWPWFPDFQGRLLRNDAQLWFPGLCHSNVAFRAPARYLEDGLYHLVHLLCDYRERERKVERYLAIEERLRVTAADPYLASYYLPERRRGLRTAAVDPRDRELIAAGLRPTAELPISRGGAAMAAMEPVRYATRAEVQARWAPRDFDQGGYRASIRPGELYRRLIAGDHRPFRVWVHNEGSEWWPGGEDRRPLIRVSYRWLTPDGDPLEGEGHRTPLPQPLGPGESCMVEMNVTAPSVPGSYLLAVDLVHEHVRWFGCDSPPVEMAVTAAGDGSR